MRARPQRQQTAKTTSIPAPVKGLNARDAIAQMDPTYALVLDNMFCTPTTVDIRGGTADWSTGIGPGTAVETVTHYTGLTNQLLFAAAGTKIYDVTTSGAVGAAKVSGMTNARWQTAQFATAGGQFLYMVNGADAPQLFDGTNWTSITGISTPAITGVTATNLVHVNAFQNRLYFVEKGTLHVWFLPLQSIGGAASKFDLSSIFTMGGYLMAMATWTVDNTSGIQEYAAFITSEGEVAIYQGYDPTFAATFSLAGVFRMGRPVGRRCFVKMGSDLAIVCSDGVALLSKELLTDRSQSATISYNIQQLINNDISSYAANFGWQPVYYPLGNKFILNVPQTENSVTYQYVMSTISGAWSTWNKENVGFSAYCFDILEDVLYFGTAGKVCTADLMGTWADSGQSIRTDMKPAFSYFGALGQSKYFTMVRPILLSTDPVTPSYILCLDYNDTTPTTPTNFSGTGTPWDTSPWDITSWGASGVQITKNWLTVGGIGYACALRMSTLTNGIFLSLQSIDYVYESGGVL